GRVLARLPQPVGNGALGRAVLVEPVVRGGGRAAGLVARALLGRRRLGLDTGADRLDRAVAAHARPRALGAAAAATLIRRAVPASSRWRACIIPARRAPWHTTSPACRTPIIRTTMMRRVSCARWRMSARSGVCA